jgi:hypothetical protein
MTYNNPTQISWSIPHSFLHVMERIRIGYGLFQPFSLFDSFLFCFDTVELQLHDDPYTSHSCLIPLLLCIPSLSLGSFNYSLSLKFIAIKRSNAQENLCWFGCVCREWCRNETSNFEYFPISAYARRAIKGITKSKPLIT